jgi:hypothetical protein
MPPAPVAVNAPAERSGLKNPQMMPAAAFARLIDTPVKVW